MNSSQNVQTSTNYNSSDAADKNETEKSRVSDVLTATEGPVQNQTRSQKSRKSLQRKCPHCAKPFSSYYAVSTHLSVSQKI